MAAAGDGFGDRLPLDPALVAEAVATYEAEERAGELGLRLAARLEGFGTEFGAILSRQSEERS